MIWLLRIFMKKCSQPVQITILISFEKWTNKTPKSLTRPAGFQFPLYSNIYTRDWRERDKNGFRRSVFTKILIATSLQWLIKLEWLTGKQSVAFELNQQFRNQKATYGTAAVVGIFARHSLKKKGIFGFKEAIRLLKCTVSVRSPVGARVTCKACAAVPVSAAGWRTNAFPQKRKPRWRYANV